jgi:hypothetical protein
LYPQGHALHNQETIEIRFMTAKDEDILTSRALLKKGLALDRLIGNLIVDKTINASDLLVGDRNAIIIAARASAYGHIYETSVTCPQCGESDKHNFNLLEPKAYIGTIDDSEYNIKKSGNGTYIITLPHTEIDVEVRLLTGLDENRLIQRIQKNMKKKEDVSTTIRDQMLAYIVSVNGYGGVEVIHHVVANITAKESRYLRGAYKTITPDLKISEHHECSSCSHEQELEVPFGADFFWPDR